MKPFTYSDYIYYTKFINIKKGLIYRLREANKEYYYSEKEINQPHDKIFKDIFDIKEEAVSFLNKQLGLKNAKNELRIRDIEKYKTKYTGLDYKNKEADVVYKKTNDNIFFLIEHQSTIDYNMPYRIFDYNVNIMRSAIDRNKLNLKEYNYPCIYSFVVYTGNQKWNAKKDIAEKQRQLGNSKNRLSCKYKVIDINELSEEQLLNDNELLSKTFLLEKSKDPKELNNNMLKILNQDLNEEHIYFLSRIINNVFKNKLDIKKFNEIIRKKIESGDTMNFIKIIEDCIDDVNEKAEIIIEKEEKVAKKEEKVAKKEEKVAKKEEKVAKKEEKVAKKEEIVSQREEKINKKISKIVLSMLKNKMEDNEIIDLLEIDLGELLKIKKENHIPA